MLKAIILASQSRAKYQNSPADFISTNLCSRGASGLLRLSACTNRQNRRSCRREVANPTLLPQSISSHCRLSWATRHLSPRIQSNCAHLPPVHHEPQGRARGRGEFSIPHPPGRSGTGLPPPHTFFRRPPPSPASAPRRLPPPPPADSRRPRRGRRAASAAPVRLRPWRGPSCAYLSLARHSGWAAAVHVSLGRGAFSHVVAYGAARHGGHAARRSVLA